MAENMKLGVQVEVSTNAAGIDDLTQKVNEAKKAAAEMVATFGKGSDEAKKAADELANLEQQVKLLSKRPLIDGKKEGQSVLTVKQRLAELEDSLPDLIAKFGQMSPEVKKASIEAGRLKGNVEAAGKVIDAFKPAGRFQALQGAIQGAAGALTVITSLQATFGKESESTQKALLKVQSALALSQGIGQINESIGSFKRLGLAIKSTTVFQNISTAAQWLWNAAMSANPIGAVVAAVAALIAGLVLLVSWLKSSAAEAEKQAAQVKSNAKEVDNLGKQLEKTGNQFDKNQAQQLALAKASGKSAEEIRKLELKLADEKIAFEQSERAIASNTRTKQLNYLATLQQNGASDETIAAQKKVVEEATKVLNDQTAKLNKAYEDKKDIENRHQVERTEAATAGENKRKENSRKAEEDRTAANKDANDKILKLTQEFEAGKIKNAEQSAKKQLEVEKENAIKEVEQSKASTELKNQQIELIKKIYLQKLAKLEEDENAKRIEAQRKYDEQRKTIEEELQENLIQIELNGITDARQRRDKELELNRENEIKDAQKRFAAGELTLTEYLTKQALIRAKYKQEEKANNESDDKEDFDKKIKLLDEDIKNEELSFAARKAAIAKKAEAEKKAYEEGLISKDEYNKRYKELTDQETDIDLKALEAKQQRAQEIFKLFQSAAELFKTILDAASDKINRQQKNDTKIQKELLDSRKITQEQYAKNVAKINEEAERKQKKIQKNQIVSEKAMAIAGIIMNTMQANAKAVLIAPPLGQPFVTYNLIQGAIGVATTIAQATKALAALGQGSDSTGDAALPSGTGGGGASASASAPLGPTPSTTALPQDQINQLASANAATRAYVVESDVTNNQDRITRLNRAARIN